MIKNKQFSWIRRLMLLTFLPFVAFAQEAGIPTDVTGVVATGQDGSIELQWDASVDPDGIVVDYKIYYGLVSIENMADDENYSESVSTGSADTSYVIDNLENGVPYYFSITAVDEEGNESAFYSDEVSATPSSAQINTPSVVSARHASPDQIEILMSKPVVVKSQTNAFRVTTVAGMELAVIDTQVLNSTVYLSVDPSSLVVGEIYEVVATSGVEDMQGNPVSSGITDTASFVAKDFSTENQAPETIENTPVKEEPSIPSVPDTVIPSEPTVDALPPADVTGLKVNLDNLVTKKTVLVSWMPVYAVDIVDQLLYLKEDNGNWQKPISLGGRVNNKVLTVKPNKNYLLRLVTVDGARNESNGAILSFTTKLSDTGNSWYLFLALGLFSMILLLGAKRRV